MIVGECDVNCVYDLTTGPLTMQFVTKMRDATVKLACFSNMRFKMSSVDERQDSYVVYALDAGK